MKERLWNVLAWISFSLMLFGVIPLAGMAIGYQLENLQDKPSLSERLSCDSDEQVEAVADLALKIQSDPERAERAKKDGVSIEIFDPEKCRIAGSGSVTVWDVKGKEVGFIYAKMSERQMLAQLGYQTFFHDLSEERWAFTLFIALPWLPLVLLLYIVTGSPRILPWKQVTDDD